MDSAEVLFDNFYDLLMDNVNNVFIKPVAAQIYSFVKDEIREYRIKHHSKKWGNANDNENDIKFCSINVCKIINLLKKTEIKREKFMRKFPEWKKFRKENIKVLNKIADDLHVEKKAVNVVNTVASAIGLAGGAAILASIVFPPATIVTIPAWLGGSAVAALLPSSVLSVVGTTTAATSTLALTGGAAAVANGATKVVTAVTEMALLKKHMDNAKDIICKDRNLFENINELLVDTDTFSEAFEGILNFQVLDSVLEDVLEFLNLVKRYQMKLNFACKLKRLFGKYIPIFISDLPMEYRIAFFGIIFLAFLIYKNNFFLFNNIVGAYQIAAGYLSFVNAFQAVATSSAVTSAENVGKVMARNVRLAAFAGIGMALDAITIVETAIDMEKGSQSKHEKKVKDASNKLQQELDIVQEVYIKLRCSMLLESQNPPSIHAF